LLVGRELVLADGAAMYDSALVVDSFEYDVECLASHVLKLPSLKASAGSHYLSNEEEYIHIDIEGVL